MSCETEREREMTVLWAGCESLMMFLMAPQGQGAAAASLEGVCENSNLERQGCCSFYQELIDNPYVDPVSVIISLIFLHL